jgi:hypothetical protein
MKITYINTLLLLINNKILNFTALRLFDCQGKGEEKYKETINKQKDIDIIKTGLLS